MNISNNVSSIQAHQTFLNNNANNIANVNTDGFTPAQTTLSTDESGSITATSEKAAESGSELSQTDLSKEMADQILIEKGVEANVAAIRTQDEMIGSLLDIKA